ncbi:MAG: hypothetical protein H7336_16145 [Bacteriovorax sp.]|nr:hypothetical protein [Bacteriovorax sp.]
MSEDNNKASGGSDPKKKDSISIIYHQKNDSPKYFEIKRSKIYLFFIGLPTLTLIALIFGAIGILNTSPTHFIQSYRDNQKNKNELAKQESLNDKLAATLEENEKLKKEMSETQEIKSAVAVQLATGDAKNPPAAKAATVSNPNPDLKCPVACPAPVANGIANSIGLSTLSLFKPIQGQRDSSRPAVLGLSGFKTAVGRDTVNLQFNIIPAVTDDSKISGHIIVLMKNEIAIEAYPLQALGGNDFQINYSAGEPFATQRFRPVDASFVKPKKSGNYSFTVFIFSKSGDLLHYQAISLPLKL